ncbi:MAG: NAD-dependent epimerase/dehydratase family protein [Caldisericia bacterium]
MLVTGSTGLVGYALSKKLVSQGHEVICPVRKKD